MSGVSNGGTELDATEKLVIARELLEHPDPRIRGLATFINKSGIPADGRWAAYVYLYQLKGELGV